MNRKIVILIFLFGISTVDMFSQKEVYVDENMRTIDSLIFSKKCKAHIFKCLAYSTDTLKINKVLPKFTFGKITPQESSQIHKLLFQRSKTHVDSMSVLVLTYRDTLYGFAHRLNSHKKHMSTMKDEKHQHPPYTRKKFQKAFKATTKKMSKCIEKTEKKANTRVFYSYKYDKGFLKDFPEHWIKDNGVIKNSFFKIMYNSHLLILKPSGEYFLGGSHLSDSDFKKLLTTADWSIFKRDWENSMISLNESGLGIFKKPRFNSPHKEHCF